MCDFLLIFELLKKNLHFSHFRFTSPLWTELQKKKGFEHETTELTKLWSTSATTVCVDGWMDDVILTLNGKTEKYNQESPNGWLEIHLSLIFKNQPNMTQQL